MMNRIRQLLNGNAEKYAYLITDEKKFRNQHYACLIVALFTFVPAIILWLGLTYISVCLALVICVSAWRLPYMLLKLSHNTHCNNVMATIPLWINALYSLLGENNIDNAIIASYETAPDALKQDLKVFIEQIKEDSANKQVYMNFLSRYEIDGFREIMMKLYEFRNLSKENLRYEILTLNKSLGKIEEMNMEKRCKGEIMMADMMAVVLISIPSLYMMLIQDILTSIIL